MATNSTENLLHLNRKSSANLRESVLAGKRRTSFRGSMSGLRLSSTDSDEYVPNHHQDGDTTHTTTTQDRNHQENDLESNNFMSNRVASEPMHKTNYVEESATNYVDDVGHVKTSSPSPSISSVSVGRSGRDMDSSRGGGSKARQSSPVRSWLHKVSSKMNIIPKYGSSRDLEKEKEWKELTAQEKKERLSLGNKGRGMLDNTIRSSKDKTNSLNALPETRQSRVASIEHKSRSNTMMGAPSSGDEGDRKSYGSLVEQAQLGSYESNEDNTVVVKDKGVVMNRSKRRSISDTTEIQSKVQQELLRQRQEELLAAKEAKQQSQSQSRPMSLPVGYTKNRSQTQYSQQNSGEEGGEGSGHRYGPPPNAFISSTHPYRGRSKSPVRPLTQPVSPIIVNTKGSNGASKGNNGGGAALPRQRPGNRLSFYVDPFYVVSIQVSLTTQMYKDKRNGKEHPMFDVALELPQGVAVRAFRFHSFKQLEKQFNAIAFEEKSALSIESPFPSRFTKSRFGLSLTMKELRTRAILLDAWMREAFTKKQQWHRRHLAATLLFFAEGIDSTDSGFSEHHQIRDGSLLSNQQDSDEEGGGDASSPYSYPPPPPPPSTQGDFHSSGVNHDGWVIGPSGEWEEVGQHQHGGGYGDSYGGFGVHEASRSKTPTRSPSDEVTNPQQQQGYTSSNNAVGFGILQRHQSHQNNRAAQPASRSLSPARTDGGGGGGRNNRDRTQFHSQARSRGNTLMPPSRSASAARSMASTYASTNQIPVHRYNNECVNDASDIQTPVDNQTRSGMVPGRGLRSLRTSRSCSPSSPHGDPSSTPTSQASGSSNGSFDSQVYPYGENDEAISALDGGSEEDSDDDDVKNRFDEDVETLHDENGYIDNYDENEEIHEEEEGWHGNGERRFFEEVPEPVLNLKLKSTRMEADGVTPMKRRPRRLTPSASAMSRSALKKSPALQRHILLFTGTDREAVHASHGQSWGAPEDVSRFTKTEFSAATEQLIANTARAFVLAYHYTSLKSARSILSSTSRGIKASSQGQLGGGVSFCMTPPQDLGWEKHAGGDFKKIVGEELWGDKSSEVLEGGIHEDKLEVLLIVQIHQDNVKDEYRLKGRKHVMICPTHALNLEDDGHHYFPKNRIVKVYILQRPDIKKIPQEKLESLSFKLSKRLSTLHLNSEQPTSPNNSNSNLLNLNLNSNNSNPSSPLNNSKEEEQEEEGRIDHGRAVPNKISEASSGFVRGVVNDEGAGESEDVPFRSHISFKLNDN